MASKVNLGDQYNYSREELDRMRRRAEIRARLQREFYSHFVNPLKQSYRIDTYDPAQQRLVSALSFQTDRQAKFFKAKHGIMFLGILTLVPAIFTYGGRYFIDGWDLEDRIRSGDYTLEQRIKNMLMPGY